MILRGFASAVLGLFFPITAMAAEPAVSPVTSSSGGLSQVVFGLFVVLAAIVLFAWLGRRLLPGQGGNAGVGGLKVVGGVYVGPKERVVVVEVGETWLLLGVSAAGVNTLHSMPRPAAEQMVVDSAGTTPPFAHWIAQALSKQKSAKGKSDASA